MDGCDPQRPGRLHARLHVGDARLDIIGDSRMFAAAPAGSAESVSLEFLGVLQVRAAGKSSHLGHI